MTIACWQFKAQGQTEILQSLTQEHLDEIKYYNFIVGRIAGIERGHNFCNGVI